MKKVCILISALCLCAALNAQEKAGSLKLYGFIRNFYAFDTRECLSGTEDFFMYVPKDNNDASGTDLNDQSSFRTAALTSRIGLDALGYEFNGLKVSAKIEADFYNGLSGTTGTAVLRLRQAYVTFGKDDWSIKAGQAWHPMAADMPDVFSLNTGAPFNPFSRTPLVSFDLDLGAKLSLTASAIWQMQYTSAGPDGASADYIKYGKTPEFYFGLNYKDGDFLARVGVDVLSIKPRANDGTKKVDDRITTVSPYFYAQYKKNLFSVKFKTIYAQAGEHMNLNGGYGVSKVNSDGSWEYTPTTNSSSWVSLAYGKKVQYILFGGYVKNFGTIDDLTSDKILYFSKNSYSNMNQMWRVTPTIIWNIGKLALGLEYEVTSVQYGENLGVNGLAEDNLHWVTNHRVQGLIKFTF